jgi:DNA (cytosine-5)-methyltransferase 1
MGLPAGWVTDLALPRTAQLRALGNGVVPQQAEHALGQLHQLTSWSALTPHADLSNRAGAR